jgi:hypothetical protein
MDVTVSISPSIVELGKPVTITYSAVDCASVSLSLDNYPAPIDMGGGQTVSGSIKVLPLTDGQFNVTILGSGRFGFANDYVPEITKTASCSVT